MAIPSNKAKEMWAHEETPIRSSSGEASSAERGVGYRTSESMSHPYQMCPLSQSAQVSHRSQK